LHRNKENIRKDYLIALTQAILAKETRKRYRQLWEARKLTCKTLMMKTVKEKERVEHSLKQVLITRFIKYYLQTNTL
jgi:hypothetical protein